MSVIYGEQKAVVCCKNCGDVVLTDEQYNTQINNPDLLWQCPQCGGEAQWSDDNYEAYVDILEWNKFSDSCSYYKDNYCHNWCYIGTAHDGTAFYKCRYCGIEAEGM
jgi:hypothetical protein